MGEKSPKDRRMTLSITLLFLKLFGFFLAGRKYNFFDTFRPTVLIIIRSNCLELILT
jgi:hypothetical protein